MENHILYIKKNGENAFCSFINEKFGKIEATGKTAFEKAKNVAKDGVVTVRLMDSGVSNTGKLSGEGIFNVVYRNGEKKTSAIDLNDFKFSQEIEESAKISKFLVILNFDSDIGILFKKNFNKDGALHLKKLEKGKLDEVLDKAYSYAQDVENEVNYQIVVEQDGFPVCFELGIITPDLDLIPKRSEEEEELNESADGHDAYFKVSSLHDYTLHDVSTDTSKTYFNSDAVELLKDFLEQGKKILGNINGVRGELSLEDGKVVIDVPDKGKYDINI